MRAKKAKAIRKLAKEVYGNIESSYEETNIHPKVYGINPITKEPNIVQVSTIKLNEDCGRKQYKDLKKLVKGI